MSNVDTAPEVDVSEVEEKREVAVPQDTGTNPFEEIANNAPRRIVGQLLKFTKGDFVYGTNNAELDIGKTKLIANMDQLLHGWIKWEDNKPVEQEMGLLVERYRPMKVADLPDRDDTLWEKNDDGSPRDPWQFTYYLLMRQLNDDGTPMEGDDGLFTFTTSSVGGKDAINELCVEYGKNMRLRPDQYPVITLGVKKYLHPNKQYGTIKKPLFVWNVRKDWAPKSSFGSIQNTNVDDGDDGDDIPF